MSNLAIRGIDQPMEYMDRARFPAVMIAGISGSTTTGAGLRFRSIVTGIGATGTGSATTGMGAAGAGGTLTRYQGTGGSGMNSRVDSVFGGAIGGRIGSGFVISITSFRGQMVTGPLGLRS